MPSGDSKKAADKGQAYREGWHGGFKVDLEATKPEAVYFTEQRGQRAALLIVDLVDPSKIPALAEPRFLTFQADVQFRVVMTYLRSQ